MSEEYLDCSVDVKPVELQEAAADVESRRTAKRIEGGGISTSIRQAGFYKPGVLHSVSVLDIGAGGISFESEQAMSTGQKVEMLIDTPVKDHIAATGRVKYCIRWASGFRIGVEFVEISSADKRILTREFFDSAH